VARDKRIRAFSLSSSRLIASFQSLTEFGMNSKARRKTFFLLFASVSNCEAFIQMFTDCGSDPTAFARITFFNKKYQSLTFAFAGVFNRAVSIHISSLFGHARHPFAANSRALTNFPATSSSLAAAIHPGA
jgi:hypothetical protein